MRHLMNLMESLPRRLHATTGRVGNHMKYQSEKMHDQWDFSRAKIK
jgi:hypothetical protein